MKRKAQKIVMGVAALAALGLGGAALANAVSGGSETSEQSEKSDSPVTGAAAAKARTAALEAAHGTKTGDVESDAEHNAAYTVEVTRANGEQLEVRLNSGFGVLSVRPDSADDHAGESGRNESGTEANDSESGD
jgi:hypothetical protein